MQTSQVGINLIKYYEGLRLTSYEDIAGIWTIGYGHTGPEVGPNQTISENQAESLLKKDLRRFEDGVSRYVKIDIDQNMIDALVSLSYNIGVNAFRKSTALKRLNKGDFLGAAEAITWWNKATINGVRREVSGLVRRRIAEAALFVQNLSTNNIGDEDEPEDSTRIQPEENSPRRNNPVTTRTTGGAVVAGAAGAAGAGSAMTNDDESSATPPTTTPPSESETTEVEPTEPEIEAPVLDTPDCIPAEEAVAEAAVDAAPDGEATDAVNTNAEEVPALPACEDTPVDTDHAEPPTTEYTTTETGTPSPDAIPQEDYTEAFQIVCGIIVVLAVVYVILARFDDWRKFRR